jgi:putative membrane protein
MKHLFLATAGAALLVACNGAESDRADSGAQSADGASVATNDAAQNMATTPDAAADIPTDAAAYAAKAGASDMFELESSKAAMAKSNNAEVDKFAQMMIDHHTQSTAKVKDAAAKSNVQLAPPKLEPMQQQMLDEIKNANAESVDAIYLRHQRTAHDAALKLHQGFAANGNDTEFKRVAGEIAPVVERHIAELGKIKTTD